MTQRLATFLPQFRERFEPVFRVYLESKVQQFEGIDPIGASLARVVHDFSLGSGKRLRAALVAIGYQAACAEQSEAILRPAIAVELLHNFFLIHDDIMDRSALRRNQPTVHEVFRQNHKSSLAGIVDADQAHFGYAMALLAGDCCCAFSYEALTTSNFPADRVLVAVQLMHTMVDATCVGQALDIVVPHSTAVNVEAILTIHRLKTAYYSFDGPLRIGLSLGGASSDSIARLERFTIPLGIAFQIQDDLLGLFGSEAELGKPVTSDVEEGKKTLLTVFAREGADDRQRARLDELLGKQGISLSELDDIRHIVEVTGARSRSESYARNLVEQAKAALGLFSWPNDTRDLLTEMAEYVIGRKS